MAEDLEMNCAVCQIDYEPEVTNPMILSCGHTFCNSCIKQLQENGPLLCPTCRTETTGIPSKNYKLQEALSVIKKLKEPPTNSLKCSRCLRMEHESEMWLCRNCVRDTCQYDVVADLSPETVIDVADMALCGSCAIRFHVHHTHETVQYFTVASARQFENHLESIKLLRVEFSGHVNELADGYTQFTSTIQTFNKEVEKMTDMMRKSKSSDAQEEFLQKINKEFESLSKSVINVAESIRNADNSYSAGFLGLVEQNEKDEVEKCNEGVERKNEAKCSECQNVELLDEMYGCVPCTEHGAQLMDETIEEELLKKFTVSSMAICYKCAIGKHSGSGEHSIVAVPEIQKKYDAVHRLLNVNMKGASMSHRFAALLNTFSHYTRIIQEYEKNISEMSKISIEMRGRDGHLHVVEELEKTIGEAENAVHGLQMSAEIQKTCGDQESDA